MTVHRDMTIREAGQLLDAHRAELSTYAQGGLSVAVVTIDRRRNVRCESRDGASQAMLDALAWLAMQGGGR